MLWRSERGNGRRETTMKLASYRIAGAASFGIVTGEGIIDLRKRLPEVPDLKALLALGPPAAAVARFALHAPDFSPEEAEFLPVIPNPQKIACIGVNYREHAAELGSKLADHPTVFIRWPDSVVGHRRPIIRPKVSERVDYEGELAVIIGRPGRAVPRERAMDLIAGYACFNDVSIRDFQRHSSQFSAGKNFVGAGAIGPWLVTSDELPDPQNLSIRTTINGSVFQDGNTADMIFDVAAIIAYLTTFTELRPGDVIATGTPKGVGEGRNPPVWLKAGDEIAITIGGIGTLSNPVIDEA
jgi:2-keto-4-pentenoate hydratase/2-oxohepta-3-ene-1,7-dioic acid hydratase in catechol pathway